MMLRALIETYLRQVGCEELPYQQWFHPTLGARSFEDCVTWQMGREWYEKNQAGSDHLERSGQ